MSSHDKQGAEVAGWGGREERDATGREGDVEGDGSGGAVEEGTGQGRSLKSATSFERNIDIQTQTCSDGLRLFVAVWNT